MNPHEMYEFLEHFVLLILLVAVALYFMHALITYLLCRLRNKKKPEKSRSILADAALSLRLAASLQADAQKFYDELIGGTR